MREPFGGAKSRVLTRQQNPAEQRICPVCGKYAQTKYLNAGETKWVYRHTERMPGTKGGTFAQSHYHEAEK